MSETSLVVLAATVAAAMAFLVRAGATPSLRTAIRTSVVLLLGWTLAYRTDGTISLAGITLRIWLMLGLSIVAFELSWGLFYLDTKRPHPSPVAVADRINVLVAAAFALLLSLGSAPQRYAFALLLISGAVVLALKRG